MENVENAESACNNKQDKLQNKKSSEVHIFLNRPMESPWKNCAPLAFPHFNYSRNCIYNMLDHNIWKNFTKDFVMNNLLNVSVTKSFFLAELQLYIILLFLD